MKQLISKSSNDKRTFRFVIKKRKKNIINNINELIN